MKTHSFSSSLRIALWLLWCDVRLFLKDWCNNALNSIFWPLVLIGVNGYVLPAMGMPADYGAFMTISMLIIIASFTAWMSATVLAADFETTRSIGYELSLPLPYWLVYTKIIVHFALKTGLFSLVALVVGKLILLDGFDLSRLNILKFIGVYALSCLFFGTFAVWAASSAGAVEKLTNLELRLVGPLFYVCGFSASWQTLHCIAPALGKAMLCTPWIYAYEGTRSAILGSAGNLNYWACCGMLLFFTLLFGLHGLWLFKKRLDCV